MSFRGVLLTVNVYLLCMAAVFLGGRRPGGMSGQLLAYACVLAQVLTISRLVRARRERKGRTDSSS